MQLSYRLFHSYVVPGAVALAAMLAAAPLPAVAGEAVAPVAQRAAVAHEANDQLAPPAVPASISAKPALWRIRRGGTTIYLFGTVHALPRGVVWFAGPVASAYTASGELVTEIIDKSPEDMRAIVLARALLPPGQTLRHMLGSADRARFENSLRANGLVIDAFDQFRPWYAAVALSTRPLLTSGFDPAHGADEELSARALAEGRRHVALETPEFQLGLFAALPMATQLRYLHEVVRNLPAIQRELRAMVRAWEAGDAPRLARLMNEDSDDPHMRVVLLVDRNKAWARWIKARLARPGTVFLAVGAGHLAGPGSVQAQLAAMRITAVRVQ